MHKRDYDLPKDKRNYSLEVFRPIGHPVGKNEYHYLPRHILDKEKWFVLNKCPVLNYTYTVCFVNKLIDYNSSVLFVVNINKFYNNNPHHRIRILINCNNRHFQLGSKNGYNNNTLIYYKIKHHIYVHLI